MSIWNGWRTNVKTSSVTRNLGFRCKELFRSFLVASPTCKFLQHAETTHNKLCITVLPDFWNGDSLQTVWKFLSRQKNSLLFTNSEKVLKSKIEATSPFLFAVFPINSFFIYLYVLCRALWRSPPALLLTMRGIVVEQIGTNAANTNEIPRFIIISLGVWGEGGQT